MTSKHLQMFAAALLLLPPTPYLPASQAMHSSVEGPAAVSAVEYRPAAQSPLHALLVLPPAPYLPASQAMQSFAVGPYMREEQLKNLD